MRVNNLPKVVTRQCPGAESNLRPWVTSGLQVRHVTVRLPSHTWILDISMDIHDKSVDMDTDGKFHIHGKLGDRNEIEKKTKRASFILFHFISVAVHLYIAGTIL